MIHQKVLLHGGVRWELWNKWGGGILHAQLEAEEGRNRDLQKVRPILRHLNNKEFAERHPPSVPREMHNARKLSCPSEKSLPRGSS